MLFTRNKKFDVYAAVGSPHTPDPWQWPTWQSFAAAVDPVVRQVGSPITASSRQYPEDCGILDADKHWSPNKSYVRFGRIDWSEAGHHTWCHDSPVTAGQSAEWVFNSYEAWAPSRQACAKAKRYPEFVFSMHSDRPSFQRRGCEAWVGPRFLLAVSAKSPDPTRLAARQAMVDIARLVDARLALHKVRRWGKSEMLGMSITDTIDDMMNIGVFRHGWAMEHATEATDLHSLLHEPWDDLPC